MSGGRRSVYAPSILRCSVEAPGHELKIDVLDWRFAALRGLRQERAFAAYKPLWPAKAAHRGR